VAWTTDRPIGRTPSRLSRPQVNFRRWPPPRTHDDARFLLADQPITTPPAGNATVASITSPSAIVSRSPSALRVAFHQRQAVCVPTPPAASHDHARIRSLVPQHHAPVSRAVSGEPAFAKTQSILRHHASSGHASIHPILRCLCAAAVVDSLYARYQELSARDLQWRQLWHIGVLRRQ
jgi:hypothetical protein